MDHPSLKSILFEVFELFPDKAKREILYRDWHKIFSTLKIVLPYLDERRVVRILDVGAGAGVIPLVLRKMGHDVSAIDTWEEYSEVYNNHMGVKEDILKRLEGNGIKTKYCDIEKTEFPYDDQSFDVVLFLDVIEHLHSSPKKVLEEIGRVLTSNGVLILTTPNLATLRNRLRVLFGKSNHVDLSYWFNSEPYFSHTREYTLGEIKKLISWTGFEVHRAWLSNCEELSLVKGSKLKPFTLVALIYLLITTLLPKLRYTMFAVARKTGK